MFCIYTQTDLTFIEHMYVLRIKKKKIDDKENYQQWRGRRLEESIQEINWPFFIFTFTFEFAQEFLVR